MCQLILTNLHDPVINKAFLASLLQIDAAAGNKDGTGFLSIEKKEPRVWKNEMSGDSILNLGRVLDVNITNNKPVMAHVRAASKGIDIEAKNSHPFSGARFCLAHNGRLHDRKTPVEWDSGSTDSGLASDSENFLFALEALNKIEPGKDAPYLISKCMESFMGKFALLIFDSESKKHYVVRGDTADLHMVKLFAIDNEEVETPIGYIVNTRKMHLEEAVRITMPIAQILRKCDIRYDKIVELDKNTIYEVGDLDLIKVGECKENVVVYKSGFSTVSTPSRVASNINLNNSYLMAIHKIYEFSQNNFLTIQDIDAMMYLFLGVPMAEAEFEDLQAFVNDVIPRTSASKKDLKAIEKVITASGKLYPVVYERFPTLEYPWTVNDRGLIKKLITELENKKQSLH